MLRDLPSAGNLAELTFSSFSKHYLYWKNKEIKLNMRCMYALYLIKILRSQSFFRDYCHKTIGCVFIPNIDWFKPITAWSCLFIPPENIRKPLGY